MRFKKLDMSIDTDKHILLTYFFKKLDTILDKKELLSMSSIYYDSEQNQLNAHTKRFQKKLEPYKDTKVLMQNVDDTIKKALHEELRIQEELVRCDLHNGNSIDHFYITVIGVDFFLIETQLRK
jgi:hypothetical protein